jgi:hypothetical protein
VKSSNKSNTGGNIVRGIGKGIGAVGNLASLLL